DLTVTGVQTCALPIFVGARPYENDPKFRERIHAFMLKSMREAKVNTSWHDPKPDYEKAVNAYIDAVFDSKELTAFVDRIAPSGRSEERRVGTAGGCRM